MPVLCGLELVESKSHPVHSGPGKLPAALHGEPQDHERCLRFLLRQIEINVADEGSQLLFAEHALASAWLAATSIQKLNRRVLQGAAVDCELKYECVNFGGLGFCGAFKSKAFLVANSRSKSRLGARLRGLPHRMGGACAVHSQLTAGHRCGASAVDLV